MDLLANAASAINWCTISAAPCPPGAWAIAAEQDINPTSMSPVV